MANKEHLRKLLFEAIPDLCRTGLPSSATFRVEAMVAITVIDDVGCDAAGEGNVTVLSFQQTVSDNVVTVSQFGSSVSLYDAAVASHKPRSQLAAVSSHLPQPKDVSVKEEEEYSLDTEEYDTITRPALYEHRGCRDRRELTIAENEEYYRDDKQYYDEDDRSDYAPGVKFVPTDDAYMDTATADGSESYEGECLSDDSDVQPSAARRLNSKLARRQPSRSGSWLGAGGERKSVGTGRGVTVERMSHMHSTAIVVRHGDRRPFECSVCRKRFSHASLLSWHCKTHATAVKKNFCCSSCGKEFRHSIVLKKHILCIHNENSSIKAANAADGDNAFKCSACERQFRSRASLITHFHMHAGLKPYECSVCDKRFVTASRLMRHQTAHTQHRAESAGFGGVAHRQKWAQSTGQRGIARTQVGAELNINRANKMKQERAESAGPGDKAKKGKQKGAASAGQKSVAHSRKGAESTRAGIVDKKNKHLCTQCGLRFRSPSALTIHNRTHSGEKPFECPVCNKRFVRNGQLAQHSRTHTGEKPFQCSLCGKMFGTPEHLRLHMIVHTGEKAYECTLCKKRFGTSSSLAVHRHIHDGDKRYKCTVCERAFIRYDGLQSHMVVHSGEKLYTCSVCGRSFSFRRSLIRHRKLHTRQ